MTNMAMNAAAVYGMCCGIFLSFCMKDPFAGRATCSDSSGLTFIYLSLFYYSLYTYLYNPDRKPSIVSANFDCRLSVRSRTSLFAGENLPHRLRWRAYFSQHPCSWTGRQSSGRKINSLPVQDCIRGKIKIKLKIEVL